MSWEQLKSITDENRQRAAAEQNKPPTACPIDGEPLLTAPDGSLFCIVGNYRYP